MSRYARNKLYRRFPYDIEGAFVTLDMSKIGQATPTPVLGKVDTGFRITILSFPTANTLGINDPRVNALDTIRIPTDTGQRIICHFHDLWLHINEVNGHLLRLQFRVGISPDIGNRTLFGLNCTSYFRLFFDADNVYLYRP
jgi:hypothetical protein